MEAELRRLEEAHLESRSGLACHVWLGFCGVVHLGALRHGCRCVMLNEIRLDRFTTDRFTTGMYTPTHVYMHRTNMYDIKKHVMIYSLI